nr:MAG TPA: hypothetical protein [Caudoviricetes sp.]
MRRKFPRFHRTHTHSVAICEAASTARSLNSFLLRAVPFFMPQTVGN